MFRPQRLEMRQSDDVIEVLMRQEELQRLWSRRRVFARLEFLHDVSAERANAGACIEDDAGSVGRCNFNAGCIAAVAESVRSRDWNRTASPPTPKAKSGGHGQF